MTAYPFTIAFLTDLRACSLGTDGELRDGSNRPVRCYVTGTPATWAFSRVMTEGGRIDAGSLAAMQAEPHPSPLAFTFGTDASGAKVCAARAIGPSDPPDPYFIG